MKKTILTIATTGVLAVIFSGCAQDNYNAGNNSYDNKNNSVASNKIDRDLAIEASQECKNYISGKFDLPNAAISINADNVYGDNVKVYVPVTVKWKEPWVDERGECLYAGGKAVRYKILP